MLLQKSFLDIGIISIIIALKTRATHVVKKNLERPHTVTTVCFEIILSITYHSPSPPTAMLAAAVTDAF